MPDCRSNATAPIPADFSGPGPPPPATPATTGIPASRISGVTTGGRQPVTRLLGTRDGLAVSGADTVGWGAGSCRRRGTTAPFGQIAQLPYTTVRRRMRGGGARVVSAEGATAPFGQIVHRPPQRGAGGSVSG